MDNLDEELRALQDTALKHAVEEMNAAAQLTLETKTERGDRGWLTGMAAKSLSVAMRVEQFMALRQTARPGGDDDEREEQEKREMITAARAQVSAIMNRVRRGTKA